ncbi:MAG: hypothetical protein IJ935_03265 [Afipia sp.]|nr:hypothetical protein [Afipia sp.]
MTPIFTGTRRYAKTPAPPADAARPPVKFKEIFEEAQNESGRHAIAAADLRNRAGSPDLTAEARQLLLDYAETRLRLVDVYDAIMKLTERCADPQIVRRLGELAAEAKARDAIDAPKSETHKEKDKPDDAAASAADSDADASPDGQGTADDD